MTEWSEQLAQLVRARGAELSRYGCLLCGDATEGADLVQEALVRDFARPRRSWSLGDVEGYVRRTMLNDFLDRRRRSLRFSRLLPRLSGPETAPDHSGGAVRRLDVVEALATLSPRQRACVVLQGRVRDAAELGRPAARLPADPDRRAQQRGPHGPADPDGTGADARPVRRHREEPAAAGRPLTFLP